MYLKFKKTDERTIYLPARINCGKYKIKTAPDGFLESVKCFARKNKQKCRRCALR